MRRRPAIARRRCSRSSTCSSGPTGSTREPGRRTRAFAHGKGGTMKKHIRRAAALGVALVMGGAIVSAIPAAGSAGRPAGSPSAPAATHVEIFDVEAGYAKTIDIGKPGLSAGDLIVENHQELDVASGRAAGTAVTQVTVIRVATGGDLLGIIDCTIKLRHGEIQFSGALRFSEVFGSGAVVPVTGGTGAYDSAGGQVVAVAGELNG